MGGIRLGFFEIIGRILANGSNNINKQKSIYG